MPATTKATGPAPDDPARPASSHQRVERRARLEWIPISLMRSSPLAQREINWHWVDELTANLDLEQLGALTVSARDGYYWLLDGQHRKEAVRQYGLGDDVRMECWVYTGLTEQDEAEMFLRLNSTLRVDAFAKFKVGVHAGRELETAIEAIVAAAGLSVSRNRGPGAIGAVGTLIRIYRRADAVTLYRTMVVARDAYGDAGLEAWVLDGLGLLIGRYNDDIDFGRLVDRLAGANGGLNGLKGKADQLRARTALPKSHCIAAAATEFYNAGRGGRKLGSWWAGHDDTGPGR